MHQSFARTISSSDQVGQSDRLRAVDNYHRTFCALSTNIKGGGADILHVKSVCFYSDFPLFKLGQFFLSHKDFFYQTDQLTNYFFLSLFSRKCSHGKSDYAWSSVAEAMSIGPEATTGILLLGRSEGPKTPIKGTDVASCVSDIEAGSTLSHLAQDGSVLKAACSNFLNSIKSLLERGTIEETTKLRFIIGFGRHLWYSNDCKLVRISF